MEKICLKDELRIYDCAMTKRLRIAEDIYDAVMEKVKIDIR